MWFCTGKLDFPVDFLAILVNLLSNDTLHIVKRLSRYSPEI